MRSKTTIGALALTLLAALAARAEDQPNKLSLGLSYLATTGNSSSQTGGLDLLFKPRFDP